MVNNLLPATSPMTRRVHAFFAPVARTTSVPTLFDPSNAAAFDPDAPPAPWLDLGWCTNFTRKSGTKIAPLLTGAPAMASSQVRTEVDASVAFEFERWGKLQMALAAGVQQMNVLAAQPNASASGSGGTAISAVPLQSGSTSTSLNVGAAASGFSAGDIVAVDLDYTGQTGFIGAGVSGGFVKSAASIAAGPDYMRRITLNVARVTSSAAGVLTLGSPLLAGTPATGMQVSRVAGFCDREGGSFFQEWSALFVLDGEQGDRILFHFPRLQAMTAAIEVREGLVGVQAGTLARLRLAGSFRALPVRDTADGEQVVCFRTYLPASNRTL